MTCNNCGTPVGPHMKFCPNCGYIIQQNQNRNPNYQPDQRSYPPSSQNQPPRNPNDNNYSHGQNRYDDYNQNYNNNYSRSDQNSPESYPQYPNENYWQNPGQEQAPYYSDEFNTYAMENDYQNTQNPPSGRNQNPTITVIGGILEMKGLITILLHESIHLKTGKISLANVHSRLLLDQIHLNTKIPVHLSHLFKT